MPQSLSQRDFYAYGDYRAWTDDRRYELIDGLAYAMSSAPSIVHQRHQVRHVTIPVFPTAELILTFLAAVRGS
jgi:hypothetical protein